MASLDIGLYSELFQIRFQCALFLFLLSTTSHVSDANRVYLLLCGKSSEDEGNFPFTSPLSFLITS